MTSITHNVKYFEQKGIAYNECMKYNTVIGRACHDPSKFSGFLKILST